MAGPGQRRPGAEAARARAARAEPGAVDARSTRWPSACSSPARCRAATAPSWPTGARCARSAPSASTATCRCASASRWSPCRPPRAASRRSPAARGVTRSAGYAASRKFLKGLKPPKAIAGTARAGRRGGSFHYAMRGAGGSSFLFTSPQLGFSIPELFVELEVHAPGAGRPRRHGPRHPGDRGRPQRPRRVGDHQRAGRRRRPVHRAPGRQGALPLQGAHPQDALPHGDVQGLRRQAGQAADLPHRPRPRAGARGSRTAYSRKYAIWGREMDTLQGLAALNGAASVAQANTAAKKLTWNENLLVADDGGHIGWWHPGRLPLRPEALGRAAAAARHRAGGVARRAPVQGAAEGHRPQAGLAGQLEQHPLGGVDQRRRRRAGDELGRPAPRRVPAAARRGRGEGAELRRR